MLLSLTWGSSYILIKRGLVAFSAEQVACLRVGISALAFLPVFIVRFSKIEWKRWKPILIVGLSGNLIPAFLFATAQTQISSSMTGLLSSLTPLFTLLLGILIFRRPFVLTKTLGIVVGLLGALFLIFFAQEGGFSGGSIYALLVLLATLCYAASSNTVQSYLNDMDAVTLSAVSFTLISPPVFIYLFSSNFLEVLETHSHVWASLGYISILALIGTVLASIVFYRLVQMTDAVFASTVSYIIPLIALGWGILDGETITVLHFIGMAMILSGVYLSRK